VLKKYKFNLHLYNNTSIYKINTDSSKFLSLQQEDKTDMVPSILYLCTMWKGGNLVRQIYIVSEETRYQSYPSKAKYSIIFYFIYFLWSVQH
jgi:hypothetical protein